MRNNAGASLVFVLAVMLLLMAIGTSALVSAGAGAGAGIEQKANIQMNLHADSIQKTLAYGLNSIILDINRFVIYGTLAGYDTPETLGGWFLDEMYRKVWEEFLSQTGNDIYNGLLDDEAAGYPPARSAEYINLVFDAPLKWRCELDSVTIADVEAYVEVFAYITPFGYEPVITYAYNPDDDAYTIPVIVYARQPQTAQISAKVTLVTESRLNDRTMLSETVYHYDGGQLEDYDQNNRIMQIKDAGDWEVVSYDRIEK